MKTKILIAIIVFSFSMVLVQSGLRAQPAQQPPRSVLEGVFNEEQLKRGTQTFVDNCSVCHGQDLSGGEIAPGLFGPNFMANWNGLTVGDLFERIRISMPPDNPDKMTRQQDIDIVSAILNANGFPMGKAELESKTEVLKLIKIEPKK
jgi:mono/diheme cytochrome c family protein